MQVSLKTMQVKNLGFFKIIFPLQFESLQRYPICQLENEYFPGYKNNVIHVQKGDFDAFEALDMDMETVNKAQSHKNAKVIKPQTCYGQEMPQSISTSGTEPRGQPGPPILPPHLLQVILNKVKN